MRAVGNNADGGILLETTFVLVVELMKVMLVDVPSLVVVRSKVASSV